MGLLDGRSALVTGSTRGIGRAIAERFASEGARVVVNGRRQDDADAVAASIPGAVGIAADQSSLESVRDLCRIATQRVGPIDLLVNNAGVAPRTAVTRVTDEEWTETLLVNLTGPFWLMRELIPGMKDIGRGTILNVTSGAGVSGTPGFSSYSASKGGLVALSLTLAKELERFNIQVNLLAPAALTDMMRKLPPEILGPMAESLPSVDDCAHVALGLVADPAVTGELRYVEKGIAAAGS